MTERQPLAEKYFFTEKVLELARLELQMPTPLPKGLKQYQPELTEKPDWRWPDATPYTGARNIYQILTRQETGQLEEFRKRRTDLFVSFGRRYAPIFPIFDEYQIHKIPKQDEKGSFNWQIVAHHTLVVGKMGEILAESMTDDLLSEKIRRERSLPEGEIDFSQFSEDELATWKQQAVSEVVLGILFQDVTKREEVGFKRLGKQGNGEALQLQQIREVANALITNGLADNDKQSVETSVRKAGENPSQNAFSAYEALMHLRIVGQVRNLVEQNPRFGNPDTIVACARFSGMPVVDYLAGGYQPSLAERIANFADKMVQDTGLVRSLEQRHQEVARRYTPVEKVDQEYLYAAECAEEFVQRMGLENPDQIPSFLLETVLVQILTS